MADPMPETLLSTLNLDGLEVSPWGAGAPIKPGSSDVIVVEGAWDARALLVLKPGGILLWIAENPLSISNWAGAPADPQEPIGETLCGNPADPSKRLPTPRECREKIMAARLTLVEEILVFPTLKRASTLLSRDFSISEPELAARMAGSSLIPTAQMPRLIAFPEALALLQAARGGLLTELSPAILFVATREPGGETIRKALAPLRDKNELAWHYSPERAIPCRTVIRKRNGVLYADKEPLDECEILPLPLSGEPAFDLSIEWAPVTGETVHRGKPVAEDLMEKLYACQWESFEASLLSYLKAAMQFWKSESPGMLSGDALDALFINATFDPKTGYAGFDFEWKLKSPVPAHWFVFRNCLVLARHFELLTEDAPFQSLLELHARLCAKLGIEPAFEECVEKESQFQALVTEHPEPGYHAGEIRRTFEHRFGPSLLPRDPNQEVAMRQEYPRLAPFGRMSLFRATRKVLKTLRHPAFSEKR